MIGTLFAIAAAAFAMPAQADVTVMAVRLGANDVVKLAKFYEAAFGLKEIDRVGNPATEIIMRYGATVAEAKAGASPEFLLLKREPLCLLWFVRMLVRIARRNSGVMKKRLARYADFQ